MVYLVGAGPGAPDLLTLRGAECLARADVVLYDGLVDPQILRHARAARHECVGKHGHSRIWTQEEITRRMLEEARAGKVVVRLKGGDPAVFARGAEEAEALAAAGLRFEIVPGITAALAAGSYAGIPITHRRHASAVALVTGHEQPGKDASALDWPALARFPGTLVVYMGVTTAGNWTAALLDAGKPADTPAAIIRRCSWPDQQVLHCRLDEVADRLSPASRIRPPVIVILGPVASLAETLGWFDHRPLFGERIVVTRAESQANELAGPLRELGAEVLLQPAIAILPPADPGPLDEALEDLGAFDWIVFSSSNGVRAFLDRLADRGHDLRALGPCRLAAIGPGTAAALAEYHLRTDRLPEQYRAESLAEALAPEAAGGRFLLVRASRGREVLAERLRDAGAHVTQVVAYSSRDVDAPDPHIAELLEDERISWVTVTSSAIARSLARLFGDALQRTRLASISPITSQTLRDLGLEPTVEATTYTIEGLIEAIETAERAPPQNARP